MVPEIYLLQKHHLVITIITCPCEKSNASGFQLPFCFLYACVLAGSVCCNCSHVHPEHATPQRQCQRCCQVKWLWSFWQCVGGQGLRWLLVMCNIGLLCQVQCRLKIPFLLEFTAHITFSLQKFSALKRVSFTMSTHACIILYAHRVDIGVSYILLRLVYNFFSTKLVKSGECDI